MLETSGTDDVKSRSLDTKGVCKDIDVFVDHLLRFEERWIFVVDVSKGRMSVPVSRKWNFSHLFEMTSLLHKAS